MKIGILTQPLYSNYGGLLQAYALQTTLKRLGHEPIVLDRDYNRSNRIRIFLGGAKRFFLRYGMWKDVEIVPFRPSFKQSDVVSKETKKFSQKHIVKTEKLYSTVELRSAAMERQLDAIVVGSDQVWRLAYSPCITNYFLDFLGDVPSVKRIAYAASFGVDQWHYKPWTTQQCRQLAQKFDAISVREDSGVDLCRKHLGVEAVHVLDPTMLLDPDDYRTLVLAENEQESSGTFLTYILDSSEEKAAMIHRVASTLGLKPFTVMPNQTLSYETQNSIAECVFPPVTQWLRGYMDAKFVIADSFHGCVFAILFNIPFIAIGNRQRGGARFVSLLQKFNLLDRLIGSLEELTEELIYKKIDWEKVNKQHSLLRTSSLNFLEVNLQKQ